MSDTTATQERTSGCLSTVAAGWFPTLALSIFVVTTSIRSSALSIPVVVELSITSVSPPLLLELCVDTAGATAGAPSAAMVPGPAGFDRALAAFFEGVVASSSATFFFSFLAA